MTFNPQAIPSLIFQAIFCLAILVYDPLVIPKKPTINDARDIPMATMGDSILLHLPPRKGTNVTSNSDAYPLS